MSKVNPLNEDNGRGKIQCLAPTFSTKTPELMLTPGTVYEVLTSTVGVRPTLALELDGTSIILPRGYRLGVSTMARSIYLGVEANEVDAFPIFNIVGSRSDALPLNVAGE